MLGSGCSDSSKASDNTPPISDNAPSRSIDSGGVKYHDIPGESPTEWIDAENGDSCIVTPAHIVGETESGHSIIKSVRGGDQGTLCDIGDLIGSNQLPDGFAQAIDKSAADYEKILGQVPEVLTDGKEEEIATIPEGGWDISIGRFIDTNENLIYQLNDGSVINESLIYRLNDGSVINVFDELRGEWFKLRNEWGPDSCITESGDNLRLVGEVVVKDFVGEVALYLEGEPEGNGTSCHYGDILIVPNVEDVNPTTITPPRSPIGSRL